ncbi:MAG: DNA (cytosine-5-)-methyltransferase [Burkholderiales bacterium]|nr:DNA (cytosine-5-)-methyltransferase [Burkholderiales bacterium]
MNDMKNYSITSLFSGCGGLDLGFKGGFKFFNKSYEVLKFDTIFANDIDKNACITFQNNFHKNIVCSDINVIDIATIPQTDIVIGGFPCQDFSHAGKRLGFDSKRGNLYKSMCNVIRYIKPKLFLAENVKGLLTIDNGNAIKTIIQDFENLGYNISYELLKVSEFGVSQKRERVIIIGTKDDILPKFNFESIQGSKASVVYEIIKDLENYDEGFIYNHKWSKAKINKGQGNSTIDKNDFAPTMRAEHHGNIEFHYNGKRRLSAREAARIQSFPDEFVFYPSTSSAYKQIGNAVPPVFAWHIAKSIQDFLGNNL